MNITVLLFAQLRDVAKADRVTLELTPGATIDDAIALLCTRHTAFEPWRQSLAAAIGNAYVARTTTLNDGDELALIPPVSGG